MVAPLLLLNNTSQQLAGICVRQLPHPTRELRPLSLAAIVPVVALAGLVALRSEQSGHTTLSLPWAWRGGCSWPHDLQPQSLQKSHVVRVQEGHQRRLQGLHPVPLLEHRVPISHALHAGNSIQGEQL